MLSADRTSRGRLISIEGLSGVGKTYLTNRVVEAATAAPGEVPLVVEEFSQRRDDGDIDLGRRLLRTLVSAAKSEHFLRAGFPKSETLLLLAIKMHDFEVSLPHLLAGRTVIEGRSIHSTAVYQSLIMYPDDCQAAAASVTHILDTAARWRPLPDLTIVLADDPRRATESPSPPSSGPYTTRPPGSSSIWPPSTPSMCACSTAASTTPKPS